MSVSKRVVTDHSPISPTQLGDLARGAAFLGTGGGGDPYIGRLMAEHAVREFGMPKIIEVDDLDDDAAVYSAAMVGAPTVMMEKAASGDDIERAVTRMAEIMGRMPDAIVPLEIGGINSMLPVVAAARLGLPLLNCDGMGRAFPEIQMVTFNVYGVSATPAVIVNEHLETVVVETNSAKRAEDLIRVSAIQMGLSVLFSGYPMTGRQVKKASIRGTLRAAMDIGTAIRVGQTQDNPVQSLLDCLSNTEYFNHCTVLFSGKITDLIRETRRGFAIGRCEIDSLEDPADQLTIEFQNEFLRAQRNGRTTAIVPDLICVIDSETAEPITVEALRYGQRVKVIGTSAAPTMRTPESLAVFGPRCFGLDEDFVRLEDLHTNARKKNQSSETCNTEN